MTWNGSDAARRRRAAAFARCLGVLLAQLVAASAAAAAEFRIQPALTVSEEYTDNALLEPAAPQHDLVTRLAPSLRTTYSAALWDWDASYTYDYRYHAETLLRNERTHSGKLDTLVRFVPETLLLEVKDDYSRVSLDLVRDYTEESGVVNQTDRNLFSAQPYAVARLSDRTTLTTGYLYRSTWYKDPFSIDTVEHAGFAGLTRTLSPRTSLNGEIRTARNNNDVLPFGKTDVSFGPAVEYAAGSTLTASAGYSRFSFERGGRTGQAFWDVRLIHAYSAMTASFEAAMSYVADPLLVLRREDRWTASVRRATERTVLEATGGVREYRDAATNHLETTSYRISGSAAHALSQRSKLSGLLTVERLEDEVLRTFTSRYLTGIRFERTVREGLVWALEYRYANVYSPDVYRANYTSNRYLIEIKKTF